MSINLPVWPSVTQLLLTSEYIPNARDASDIE